MKRKNIVVFSLTALFALICAASYPVSTKALETNAMTQKERVEARATLAADKQTDQLSKLIQRGDTMIADRIKSLQKLLERINADKKLSSIDKTNLTNDVNSTMDALNALKTKIDADTDVTTARADVKSIITNFHIYVLYEPKIRLLITIGNLQTHSTNISILIGKVQVLITDLKNQGKDTASAQNALNDASTQLTAINTLLTTDKTLIGNVNFQTTNPQSVYTQVRKDLATIRADFAKIRSDFATIRGSLKLLIQVKTGTASGSAK